MLQCDSKYRIALYLNCKNKNIILFIFSLICLLTLSLSQLCLPCLSLPLSLSLSLCDFSSPFAFPQATIAQQRQAQVVSRCFAPMWLRCFALMGLCAICSNGSWVRWWIWIGGSVYHGPGDGVGLDRWRLVGLWVWIDGVCVASSVASMVTLMVIFFWLGLMVGFWFSLN